MDVFVRGVRTGLIPYVCLGGINNNDNFVEGDADGGEEEDVGEEEEKEANARPSLTATNKHFGYLLRNQFCCKHSDQTSGFETPPSFSLVFKSL